MTRAAIEIPEVARRGLFPDQFGAANAVYNAAGRTS